MTVNAGEDLPDGLVWHYTDGPGLISILSDDLLWATSSQFLNDHREGFLGSDMLQERVDQRATRGDPLFQLIRDRVRESGQGQGPSDGQFFILSASRAWDSLSMWRSYGRARECYAIGLDPEQPLLVLGDASGPPGVDGDDDGFLLRHRAWAPVHYALAEQEALVDAVLDRLPEEVGRFRGDPPDRATLERATLEGALPHVAALLDDLEQVLLLSKHEGFSEEQETRYCTVLYRGSTTTGGPANVSSFVRFRSTVYGVTPYLRLTGRAEDRPADAVGTTRSAPLPIRGIAVSPSPNGDAATESIRDLLATTGYAGTPVRRSVIPFRS